eukprot:g20109.t1
MSMEMEQQLRAAGQLLEEPQNGLHLSAGLGRHWPQARGVYTNGSGMVVWINQADHLRLAYQHENAEVFKALEATLRVEQALSRALEAKGFSFSSSDGIGSITFSPENSGSAVQASARLSLPRLAKNEGTSKVDDHELHRQRLQWFQEHLHPLLTETNATFHTLAKRFEQFRSAESQVIEDLAASARMLSLRASQSSDEWCKGKLGKLALAKEALRAAQVLAREQEWREAVPTAYRYGYLWAADKLFYWHRDQEMVEKGIDDVCFRTINDPIELGLSGGGGSLAHWARSLVRSFASNHLWHLKLSECLGPPVEPKQGRNGM